MKSITSLLSILLLYSYASYSQKADTNVLRNADNSIILDTKKTLQTEIFILNTCEPNQLSLVKMYDDYRQVKVVPVRKLSISTNRFSSFKIININPNRYNYNINNTLVTQFMDSNPLSLSNNTYTNGTPLPVNEIEIIELFKIDKNIVTKREKIDRIKKEMDSISTVIQNAYIQMGDLKSEANQTKDSGKKQKILTQINDIQNNKYLISISNYRYALNEYGTLVKALTIDENYLLENFRKPENDSLITSKDLKSAVGVIYQLAENLKQQNYKLETIKNKITQLSNNNFNSLTYSFSKNSDYDSYEKIKSVDFDPESELSGLGYMINTKNLYSPVATERFLEITKMNEFISEKKINEWEIFVLSASRELGKLLQNNIIEYSEQKNIIAEQTCIDNEFISKINKNSQDLRNNFKVIRNISADITVLIKCLELNDAVFGSIVNGVNNNYNKLKEFLKFLDYTSINNTVEFTLPTHTNLKNVDLIRYQISREDKITHESQSYVYDIWLKGGLKIDFSAGIFATSLIDYEYEKLQAPSTSNPATILVDSIFVNRVDNGKFDLAFGAMVNISIRTGASWVTPGFSIGTAYGKNQKLQFLGAFSLQLGKTERLILHAGYAAGLSKTLNLATLNYNTELDNEEGKHYLVKAKYEEFNIPTTEKFYFKPFFGISYNLSKKNALQAASNSYNYAPNNDTDETKPIKITQ